MSKSEFETMSNAPEDFSIRSPVPQYQPMHTPASTAIGSHDIAGPNVKYCHVVHCNHGESLGEGSRANVVPVALVERWPALIECPACKGVTPTTTDHTIGKGAHWMAVMLFFTTGVGVFAPYAMRPFKDVVHSCQRCGRKVATRRFGGGTKAHLM
ncbi:LITAF-like zinc ribbon domain-containing protein [Colletotrichum lupini]|nr:LITAF-like zinc ribbon domain-containing protein [Colletotrichum lupini]